MEVQDYIRHLMEQPKDLAFSEQEYQQRISSVRLEMSKVGLDVLLITFHPNLFYFAGYTSFATDKYACLLIPQAGDLLLQIPIIDIPGAVVSGWLPSRNILPFHGHEPRSATKQIAAIMKERGLSDGRVGLEFNRACFSHQFYLDLVENLPDVRFENIPMQVLKGRQIKSASEVEYLRRAAAISSRGLNASLEVIAAGKTENEIVSVGYEAMIAAGGEFFSTQPIVAGGRRSGSAHAIFKRHAVEEGDTVLMEYGGCYERYTSPMSRTATIGKPSADVSRMFDLSRKMLDHLLENAQAGMPIAELARGAGDLHRMSEQAFSTGIYGYSVGLGFPPTWNEGLLYITEDSRSVLEPGMVFHVAPFLRAPAKFGIGLSETILVTDGECEVLTDVPGRPDRKLHVRLQ